MQSPIFLTPLDFTLFLLSFRPLSLSVDSARSRPQLNLTNAGILLYCSSGVARRNFRPVFRFERRQQQILRKGQKLNRKCAVSISLRKFRAESDVLALSEGV